MMMGGASPSFTTLALWFAPPRMVWSFAPQGNREGGGGGGGGGGRGFSRQDKTKPK
jgi:hypothetical protein